MKGILRVPIPTLGVFLCDVLKGSQEYSLTRSRFRRAFANTLTESESRAAYERYVVPGPNRMLLQAEFAWFTPRAATSVKLASGWRTAHVRDHTVGRPGR